jgi:hypothetical protein
MLLMSVILDTSQFDIGPCGPLKQSPWGWVLRHASMALLSFAVDVKADMPPVLCLLLSILHMLDVDIDPCEPSNISFADMAAVEWTQEDEQIV